MLSTVIPIFKLRTSSFICHAPHTAYIHWKSYAKLIPNGTSISLSALITGHVSTVGISRSVSYKEQRFLSIPAPDFPVKEDELPETVRLVHSPVFEISSTFIRQSTGRRRKIYDTFCIRRLGSISEKTKVTILLLQTDEA